MLLHGESPPIELGTLGMSDTLILMVLALVVFGPRRLPQIGRQIGKLMYEFRKASNDFKFQMEEELRTAEEADRRKREEAERARNLALNPPAQTIESQAAVGAQESVSAPSHPLYGSGSGYPEAYPPETAAARGGGAASHDAAHSAAVYGRAGAGAAGTRDQGTGNGNTGTEGTRDRRNNCVAARRGCCCRGEHRRGNSRFRCRTPPRSLKPSRIQTPTRRRP